MERTIVRVVVAMIVLLSPSFASAAQPSGIWIYNNTGNCLWVTVYDAGSIVKQSGFPNWVPRKDKRLYPVRWKGVGQAFRVRTEILSTPNCAPQNAQHPLAADISTTVQGNLAYRVAVEGSPGSFQLVRF